MTLRMRAADDAAAFQALPPYAFGFTPYGVQPHACRGGGRTRDAERMTMAR